MGQKITYHKLQAGVSLPWGFYGVRSLRVSYIESTWCLGRKRKIASLKLPSPYASWWAVKGLSGCVAEGDLLVPEAELKMKDGSTTVKLEVISHRKKPLLTDTMLLGDLLNNLDCIHFSLFEDGDYGLRYSSIRWRGRRSG